MQNYPVYTFEILLIVVMPLLVLYLKRNWPLRKVFPALVIIPVLWYFTYVPLHELSHAAGIYLVGGKVIGYKLIPRFWLGEFARAWVIPSGITQSWQQLTFSAFPLMLDIVSLLQRYLSLGDVLLEILFLSAWLSCFYASGLQLTLYLNLLVSLLAGEVKCGTYNRLPDPLQHGHLS